jgi:hypothetical protein
MEKENKITHKFHYNSKTRVIDVRPFFDDDSAVKNPYIQLTYEEWQSKLQCSCDCKVKAYIDGEIVDIDDPNPSTEKKIIINEIVIAKNQQILSDTDYVITKLNELSLTGTVDELAAEKEKYADILQQRKNARDKINELRTENSKLKTS